MSDTSPAGGRREPKSREQRLSAVCAAGCGILAIGIPLAVAAFWALGSWETLALVRLIPPDILGDMSPGVQPWQRVVGAAIDLVPALLLAFGLVRARRCLQAFARGDFFAAEVIGGLKAYAAASFWAAIAGIVAVPVLSVAITLANRPGHKELSADLSGAQVLNLLAAAIVWVIAQALVRAASIARENEQFV